MFARHLYGSSVSDTVASPIRTHTHILPVVLKCDIYTFGRRFVWKPCVGAAPTYQE